MPVPSPLTSICLVLATASVLGGCLKVERRSGTRVVETEILLARAEIKAEAGGTVSAADDSIHAGVQVYLPPGALEQDTEISIYARYGNPELPSILPSFRVEPVTTKLRGNAAVTVVYSEHYEALLIRLADESTIEVFSTQPTGGFRFHQAVNRDPNNNRISILTPSFGEFLSLHGTSFPLLFQKAELLDPATEVEADLVQGQWMGLVGGPDKLRVGQGSLADFWQSGADANLIILHGFMGTPFQLLDQGNLLPLSGGGLQPEFRNIVAFQYPSGRGIATNANLLYNQIISQAQPGFGCKMIAHSTGGLIARYAIERSDRDPNRVGFTVHDPSLDRYVERVVLLGTPNRGAVGIHNVFADLLNATAEFDARFVQGILDLYPEVGGLTDDLFLEWRNPATAYLAIAGDTGFGSDEFVNLWSATGLPVAWNPPSAFQVFSGRVYNHQALSAYAAHSGVVALSLAWLGKTSGNTAPIVGSVSIPSDTESDIVGVPFRLTDHESDRCFIGAEYSIDGSNWIPATPAVSQALSGLAAGPAPGRPHTFLWNAEQDTQSHANRRLLVQVRISANDGLTDGFSGESGQFLIEVTR